MIMWSIALAAVGILGIWLAGRKNLWGWAIGVSAQMLWIVYACVTQQWGFIASALAYGTVYGLNWYKWHQANRSPADIAYADARKVVKQERRRRR